MVRQILLSFAILACWSPDALSVNGAKGSKLQLKSQNILRSETFNLEYDHIPDQLIVKFKSGFSMKSGKILSKMKGKTLRIFKSSKARLISFPKNKSDIQLLSKAKQFMKLPYVEYVEANTILTIGLKLPNDPKFSETYGLHNTGSTGGAPDADIDAPEAWEISTGSRDIVVGIIDTGVDYNHQDIAANYWTNPGENGLDSNGQDKKTNGVDDDQNGYVDDFRGWDFVNEDNDPVDDHNHGTHCAGTIGGVGNDGQGVSGVNWKVSMVGLKFLSSGGSGSLENAVRAIEYATSLGVDLTSNSWGGGGFSETMHAAISSANSAGVLFVAAAGNSGSNNDSRPHYPSSYQVPNIIAVAATDHSDGIASFSNYGASTVHLAAPGVSIVSTIKGNEYDSFSGTSMATPHVSGVAALVMAAYPMLSSQQVKARIMRTADPLEILALKTVTGGRLNAYNAMENDQTPPGQVTGFRVLDTLMTAVKISWRGAGDDGDVGEAARYQMKISDSPVTTAEQWNAAQPVLARISGVTRSGTIKAVVAGLPFNRSGYFTIKPIDNAGNLGPMAPSIAFAVERARAAFENQAESLDGVEVTGTWGLQAVSDSNKSFSDSPDGEYGREENSHLLLPAISQPGNQLILSFDTKYELEINYDFGRLELSIDQGQTWTEIMKFTGRSNEWERKIIDLREFLEQDSISFLMRMRLTTDYSVSKDGWQIDNIRLYAPVD